MMGRFFDDNLSAMRGTDSGRTGEEVERARFHFIFRDMNLFKQYKKPFQAGEPNYVCGILCLIIGSVDQMLSTSQFDEKYIKLVQHKEG